MPDIYPPPGRKPVQKTYGKAVKRHGDQWHGADLWIETEKEAKKGGEPLKNDSSEDSSDDEDLVAAILKRGRPSVEEKENRDPDKVGEGANVKGSIPGEDEGPLADNVENPEAAMFSSRRAKDTAIPSPSTPAKASTIRKQKSRQGTYDEEIPETPGVHLIRTEIVEEAEKHASLSEKKVGRGPKRNKSIPPPDSHEQTSERGDTKAEAISVDKDVKKSSRSKRTKSKIQERGSKSANSRSKTLREIPPTPEPDKPRRSFLAAVEIPVAPKRIAPTLVQAAIPSTPPPPSTPSRRITPIPVTPVPSEPTTEPRKGSVRKKELFAPPNKSPFTPHELSPFHTPLQARDVPLKPRRVALTSTSPLPQKLTTAANKAEPEPGRVGLVSNLPLSVGGRTKEKRQETAPRRVAISSTSPLPAERQAKAASEENDPLVQNLTQKMEKVVIDTSSTAYVAATDYDQEEYDEFANELEELLQLCDNSEPIKFNEYIRKLERESLYLKKLGEASYSEVFVVEKKGGRKTVLKVIPFGGEDQCKITDIVQEVKISKIMSETRGFIGFHGAYVTEGKFPKSLLDKWDAYDEAKGSENDRPDFYEKDQLFAVILLEHGGIDLEHFPIGSWSEALDIFWQVVQALAAGESQAEFEHRDLHWGNVVINQVAANDTKSSKSLDTMLSNLSLSPSASSSLKVCLIDYTLSRARLPNWETPTFTPLSDPALFTGKGDYQFDIYRFMRRHFQNASMEEAHADTLPDDEEYDLDNEGWGWSAYRPKTNVFWVHYIAQILLQRKGLKRPGGSRRTGDMGENEEKAYRTLENASKRIDPRKKRWGDEGESIECAGDIVKWAIGEGYLQ